MNRRLMCVIVSLSGWLGGCDNSSGDADEAVLSDALTSDMGMASDAAHSGPDANLGPRMWRFEKIFTEADGLLVPDGLFAIGGSVVLLANEGNDEVLQIDVDTRTIETVYHGPPLKAPEEVAVGADGTIYISDDSAGAVFRVNGNQLEPMLTRADGLVSPEGIAIGVDGTIFVGDEAARILMRRRPNGQVDILADEDDGVFAPEGLVIATDGTVYVTDDRHGGVMALDPDGSPRVFLDRSILSLPEAVAVDTRGQIWFTDNGKHEATIQRFNKAGEHLETIDAPVAAGNLAGLVVLSDERLVFSVFRSRETHELWVATPEAR